MKLTSEQALSPEDLRNTQGGVYYPVPPCIYPGPNPTWPVGPIGPVKPAGPIFNPITPPYVITHQIG